VGSSSPPRNLVNVLLSKEKKWKDEMCFTWSV
jgi:hypothetical protein